MSTREEEYMLGVADDEPPPDPAYTPTEQDKNCVCDSPAMHAGHLWLDMTAAWMALALAERYDKPIKLCVELYKAYLTALDAYVQYRRDEWLRQQMRAREG